MSQDWNSSWTPPGADPYSAPETSHQDTGWDWSWLFTQNPTARPAFNPRGGPAPRTRPGDFDLGQWLQGVFTQSPEDQLTSLILQKMGGGTLSAVAANQTGDPKAIAAEQWRVQTARDTAHRAMNDPSYREQLAQSLGWNMANPHVAYWVMHGGGVPNDPTSSGVLSTGQSAGSQQQKQQPGAGPTANIGAPFDPKAYAGRATDPGFLYGAVLPPAFAKAAGIDRQWGIDYALPLGTPQNSPWAGTVKEAGWNGPYGYTVVVQMASGYTYRVAHLGAIASGIHVGATVAVGALLGPTGSTGNSTGSHVLIEMRDSNGKPIDPTPIIDSLLKGDASAASKVMGDYVAAGQSMGPFLTSDGHLIYPGSQDYNVFFAAQQLWRRRYGGDPPWTFVSSLIAQGATTSEGIQSYMDQMASDITGMNWGARDALTQDANQAAQKAWDRTVPDSTIKNLAAQGITTPVQIQAWIAGHPASSLDKADFKAIYDAANPKTQQLWQQPPSPDLVKHIHDQMNTGPQS